MRILINASNLKIGGGIQVADSICCSLNLFPRHFFIVVLSSVLYDDIQDIHKYNNVVVFKYDIPNNCSILLRGRNSFLDSLVQKERVDVVLTIFGPSRWEPICAHLCGFARAQLICKDSPYFTRMSIWERFQSFYTHAIVRYYFFRRTRFFYSENESISKRIEKSIKGVKCYTVTNYYNQIFDQPDKWRHVFLPKFDGVTLLNIGANYPHKNLDISIEIARILLFEHPGFRFRFVFTLNAGELHVPSNLRDYFIFLGRVGIEQCPYLYKQADIMFQPTLLECFTATYPEAMRMRVPIVTTDLEFSKGLCADAALYYSPLDAHDAVDKILSITGNPSLAEDLKVKGIERLKSFDDYNQRSEKLFRLCEQLVNKGR